MELLITLAYARDNSLLYYFTGKPCKYGHISLRQTSDRQCKECKIVKNRIRIKTEKHKIYKKKYSQGDVYKKNKKECDKRYRIKNKDTINKYKSAFKKTEKGKLANIRYLKGSTYNSEEAKARRRASKTASEARRRASKKSKISSFFKKEIFEIYLKCQEMGSGYQVDHISPINGPETCGLHVPWNLQIITKEENMKKSNKILL